MDLSFAIVAALTVVSAIAAMSLRNLVHCALCLTLTFAGIAALYLQLDAQFVGFAQILVYIGAVAVLIVFSLLLTRNSDSTAQPILSGSWLIGAVVAVLAFSALAISILLSAAAHRKTPLPPETTVRKIGEELMTNYVLPLEVVALLLTAAMIGAVIIAMREKGNKS